MIGTQILQYNIIEKIGEGGMGIVYKAEDTRLKRYVALKFLPPELISDTEAKRRFIQEAQAVSRLDHPNICTVHEINESEDDKTFIAMAYYKGKTLKNTISQSRITINEAIAITAQIGMGLAKAHEEGIIHRDIKPGNIFITDDGIAKILDFGLAKLVGQSKMTKTGSTPGTTVYMSPEQIKGDEVDQRSDIWSLGIILYELLTGEPPFKGDYEQAVMYAIINKNPQSTADLNKDVSSELEQVIEKMLQKEPKNRCRNIGEFLTALE